MPAPYGGIGPTGGPAERADGSIPVFITGDTSGTGGGTPVAAADAVANPTAGITQAFGSGFNGTTWDRLRAGLSTISATLTGMLNTLPWALFHTAPVTRTNGQGGPLETDSAGNLRQVLMNPAVAVDDVNGKIVVEHRYSFLNMTTATTTTIKSGAGLLHAIIVHKAIATATISIFDNTAGSGTPIGVITFGAALLSDPPLLATYDLAFSTGLTVVTSGATNVTFIYR